jgi:integrase
MTRRTLTAETIGRIKPGAARREIADAVLPGLYLVVQPSGARSFAVRTRVAGKPVKITVGRWPVIELAKARELARAKLQSAATGADPRRVDREAAEAARRTVAVVCDDWLRRDQADNRDVATVRRIMAREVLPFIGEMPIEAVRKRDLIAVIDRVVDRAPVRANRVLAHTKRLFRWAAARDLIEVNPAASIEKPTAERARDRVLSDAELVAIWRAAERVGGAYGAGVRLLMLTGARMAEIFEARGSEIDGDALRLPAERSKSKEGRTIWLSPAAQEIVAGLPRWAGADWLLTASGRNPFRAFATSKIRLDKELAPAALPPWRHHDFRRTLATGLQRMGVRLEVIETILGHVSGTRAGIVGTYQKHRFEAEAAEAVRRWGDHMAGLLSPAPANVVELRRGAS